MGDEKRTNPAGSKKFKQICSRSKSKKSKKAGEKMGQQDSSISERVDTLRSALFLGLNDYEEKRKGQKEPLLFCAIPKRKETHTWLSLAKRSVQCASNKDQWVHAAITRTVCNNLKIHFYNSAVGKQLYTRKKNEKNLVAVGWRKIKDTRCKNLECVDQSFAPYLRAKKSALSQAKGMYSILFFFRLSPA